MVLNRQIRRSKATRSLNQLHNSAGDLNLHRHSLASKSKAPAKVKRKTTRNKPPNVTPASGNTPPLGPLLSDASLGNVGHSLLMSVLKGRGDEHDHGYTASPTTSEHGSPFLVSQSSHPSPTRRFLSHSCPPSLQNSPPLHPSCSLDEPPASTHHHPQHHPFDLGSSATDDFTLQRQVEEKVRRFSLVLEDPDENDDGYAVGLTLEDSTPPTNPKHNNPLYMSDGFAGIGRSTTIMSTCVIPDYFDPLSTQSSQPRPIANSVSNTTVSNTTSGSSSTSSLTTTATTTTLPSPGKGSKSIAWGAMPIAPHLIESSSSLATTDLGEWEEEDHEVGLLADLKI
ncbi:hypothetical protein TrVE_jg4120 [Triparma verrucosa]|uniref:Uncharacterized protein n=1 Tax=Triparma verrucosa TaxID=1606542 RepID=A0A9W7C7J9_9STRA|nr:hypothetical protein TrVE_jg4120 [Triparma verrucosa]